jgi:hypothetical protein
MSAPKVGFAHQREFNGVASALETKSKMAGRQNQIQTHKAAMYRQFMRSSRPQTFTTHFQPKHVTSQDMFIKESATHQQLSPRQQYIDKLHAGSRMSGTVYNPREEGKSCKKFNAMFDKRSNGDCQSLRNKTLKDQGHFHDLPKELSPYTCSKKVKHSATFEHVRAKCKAEEVPEFKTLFYAHKHTTAQDMEAHESRVHQKLSPRALYSDAQHKNGLKNFDHNPAQPSCWLSKSNFNSTFGRATVVYEGARNRQQTCLDQADDWMVQARPKSEQLKSSPVRLKKSRPSSMLSTRSISALAQYDRLLLTRKQQGGGGLAFDPSLHPPAPAQGQARLKQRAQVKNNVHRPSESSTGSGSNLSTLDIQMRTELDEQRHLIRTPSMMASTKSLSTLEFSSSSSLLRHTGQAQIA